VLDELLRRGRANGVELHEVDAAGARELEPGGQGVGGAPGGVGAQPRRRWTRWR
jgi:hypothetical protein